MANPQADNIKIPLNLWIGSRSVFGFLPIRYPLISLNLFQNMEFKNVFNRSGRNAGAI